MNSLENIQKEIEGIKRRNQRVEADKAWETSWTRKIIIAALTYLVIVILLFVIELANPFINAIIPSIAFLLSTSSMPLFKKWWLKKITKQP